jgi:hypothetical protein
MNILSHWNNKYEFVSIQTLTGWLWGVLEWVEGKDPHMMFVSESWASCNQYLDGFMED